MKTDDLDERILAALRDDARVSNREVARLLDVADVTVGKRLARLQSAGMARASALVEPQAVGLTCAAFVRLVTEPRLARKIAAGAAELKEVSFVALTAGTHNVVMLALVEDRDALSRLVHAHFRTLGGVRAIDTREIMASVKQRLDVVRISRPVQTDGRGQGRRLAGRKE